MNSRMHLQLEFTQLEKINEILREEMEGRKLCDPAHEQTPHRQLSAIALAAGGREASAAP